MNRCSTFYDSWAGLDLLNIFVLAPLWFALCLYLLLSGPFGPETIFFLVGLTGGIIAGLYAAANYAAKTALYSADEAGITLRLFGRFDTFRRWEEIDSIVLCDIVDQQMTSPFPVVIRIALRKEKYGPLSREKAYSVMKGCEKWHGLAHWQNHPRSVVCIDYSKERLEEIAALSGREIPEKWSSPERRKAAYKLYKSLNQEAKS